MSDQEPSDKPSENQPLDTEGAFYNLVAENPDPILIVDQCGLVKFCNPAGGFLLRRKCADLVGTGFGFPVITDKKTEIHILHPIEVRTAEMHAIKTLWDGQEAFLISLRDITDRKEAENKIRKLSTAVEQSPSSVMITDRYGRIEYVNPMFCRVSGYSCEETIGKSPRIIKSGKHTPAFYEDLWNTILRGDVWHSEICNRRKNGELYWDLQSISPLRDPDGEITHFISVRIEDTERRRAEERLKVYAEALKRSNKELDEFASYASHDLQEPLRKIIAFGERLKERITHMDEHSKDYLERMQRAATRMQRLVNDLLQYSRLTTKALPMETLSVKNILNDVLEDLQYQIETKHGSIIVSELPDIVADPMQIRRLFQNLISNAIKFSKKDVPPLVEIESSAEDTNFHKILVKDHGIGFDSKYNEKIFKPFERLHGKTEYEGTGIGLAICKKIMERHHGSIEATSVPGEFTVFSLKFPKTQPMAAFQ